MPEQACGNKQKNPPALTIPVMWAKMILVTSLDPDLSGYRFFVFNRGPVAQLGARFHGMEEVVGSIPTRSTIFSQYLPCPFIFTRRMSKSCGLCFCGISEEYFCCILLSRSCQQISHSEHRAPP
jgi:hypothetical protein